jgi:thiol-disulfide isomerase/thioredoxin
MKNKSINQVSIINGEDGPTSVFIFGEAQKQSLKIRIRNAIYQSRRKRIEKRIAANPHTLAPVIDELAGDFEGKANICKVNTDEEQDLAVKYGIRSIPTIIFMKNGEVVDQLIGATSKQALTDKINSLL